MESKLSEKMTIHRGLSELKLIDSRIEKQITEISPVGINRKGKMVDNIYPEEDFRISATSKFQSMTDLIERKSKIKSAIVKSNGTTMVKVGEKEMTVSDAITFKGLIKFKKMIIDRLLSSKRAATANMNKNNQVMEDNIKVLLEAALGKDNVKTDSEQVDAIRKPYTEANEFFLFDHLNIDEKVSSLELEINSFTIEIDAVLSESNATTFIEF